MFFAKYLSGLIDSQFSRFQFLFLMFLFSEIDVCAANHLDIIVRSDGVRIC